MNLIERTQFAMENFMSFNPEKTKTGQRCYFNITPFPSPSFSHCQWDDGDCTSRALDNWLFAREITGDVVTGKEIESGQLEYLKNLIDPETGLCFVGDHSRPNTDGYYFHMWDQGRVLKHLISRCIIKGEDLETLSKLIEKIIDSSLSYATKTTISDGKVATFWEHDTFFNNVFVQKGHNFGSYSFLDFTFVCAVFLAPVCDWYQISKNKKYLRIASELAEGFVAGLEKRRESKSPMFDETGKFYGHVHCSLDGLTGLVKLANHIYSENDGHYKKYLDIAISAYAWIFSEDNKNRGSSCGFIMENFGEIQSDTSEICCTADMIEFASLLAETGSNIPEYSHLDSLWDDVDRFTINELFRAQVLHPERLLKFLEDEDVEKFNQTKDKYLGGWIFGHSMPHDFARVSDRECSGLGATENITLPKIPTLPMGGCCLYSGVRGFYSYWKSIVSKKDDCLEIRFAGRYKDATIDMSELSNGGLCFLIKRNQNVIVRIPETADLNSVSVLKNGNSIPFDIIGRRVAFFADKDSSFSVIYKNLSWEIKETLGMPNDGRIKSHPAGKRITYTLSYTGNKLTGISPNENAYIPYADGL